MRRCRYAVRAGQGDLMRIAFDDCGDTIAYRVHDFDPKHQNTLQACFYEDVGTGWVKRYPKQSPYLDQMMRRYARCAPDMFDQLGRFVDTPWQDGLEAWCRLLEPTGIFWWLTGSCAACIRGVPLLPHDIDIMVDSRDTGRLTELLKDCLIEPITDTLGWLTKDFGVAFLHCRIDIASDPVAALDLPEPIDCGPYARDHLDTVVWRGQTIRVPPLELQLAANRRRGRSDRIAAIEDFLASRSA